MMNQPPIDELAAKTDGNKYKLCTVIAKRAKELEKSDKKAISIAAEEVYNGTIVASEE